MLKLLPAFLCLDVYLQWLRLSAVYASGNMDADTERAVQRAVHTASSDGSGFIWPYNRHSSIIALEAAGTAVYWGAILLVAWFLGLQQRAEWECGSSDASAPTRPLATAAPSDGLHGSSGASVPSTTAPSCAAVPSPSARPTPLLLALILSSFGKFFSLLPLVWSNEYAQIHLAARAVQLFVIGSNLAAIRGRRAGNAAGLPRLGCALR